MGVFTIAEAMDRAAPDRRCVQERLLSELGPVETDGSCDRIIV